MRGCRGRRKKLSSKGFFFSPCKKSIIFYNSASNPNAGSRDVLFNVEIPQKLNIICKTHTIRIMFSQNQENHFLLSLLFKSGITTFN